MQPTALLTDAGSWSWRSRFSNVTVRYQVGDTGHFIGLSPFGYLLFLLAIKWSRWVTR